MKLIDYLKNILKNKKIAIGIPVFVFLLICIMVVCVNLGRNRGSDDDSTGEIVVDEDKEGSNTIIVESDEDKIEQKKKEAEKKRFSELSSSFNQAVEEYNTEAKSINEFVENVAAYNVVAQENPIDLLESVSMDYLEYTNTNKSLDELSVSVDYVTNKTRELHDQYYVITQMAIDAAVDRYNLLAKEYNYLVDRTCMEFITGVPFKADTKETGDYIIDKSDFSEKKLISDINYITNETNYLLEDYLVIKQITNPDPEWVFDRLNKVRSVTGIERVSHDHDPNGQLGKTGGYSACFYFTINQIDASSVVGQSILDKGTDAGGCIEIYPNKETAEKRCEYLGQFDNTLLYSGSYAAIGTMVVRTSYKLSTQEQIDLTDEITTKLTEVEL